MGTLVFSTSSFFLPKITIVSQALISVVCTIEPYGLKLHVLVHSHIHRGEGGRRPPRQEGENQASVGQAHPENPKNPGMDRRATEKTRPRIGELKNESY